MPRGWFAYKLSQFPNMYINDEIYNASNFNYSAVNISDPIAWISEKLGDSEGIWRKVIVVGNQIDVNNYTELRRVFDAVYTPTTVSRTDYIGSLTLYSQIATTGNLYAVRYARTTNPSWAEANNLTPFTVTYEKASSGVASGGFSIGYTLGNIAMFTEDKELIVSSGNPIKWLCIDWKQTSTGVYSVHIWVASVMSNTVYTNYINDGGDTYIPGSLKYADIPYDPYGQGGTTKPTPTPTGNFNNTTDPIDPQTLPTLSAVDTNFITLFSPNLTQLRALSSYMWGGLDLELFKKLFANPMDAILGLSIVPVTPDQESSPSAVTLGNITTTVSMPKITTQYKQVYCGTLNIDEYWGAYLDYSPYTKIEIYLPYVGIQTLDADDVMGKTITVIYNVDVLSGACVAMLKCDNSVLYTYAGSCAVSIPITGRDWTNVINGVIGVATAAAGVAVAGATGGASVAAAAAGSALGSTANQLTSIKPTVQKSGTMASAAGILANQKPYLIITRPNQALPDQQNKYTGYPSYITQTLGSCSGFTIVDRIHLSGVRGTDAEIAEILALLKEGVIL